LLPSKSIKFFWEYSSLYILFIHSKRHYMTQIPFMHNKISQKNEQGRTH
jgi:hypothetical protein